MEFLAGNSIWAYIGIFFGKIIEVTLATLRMVLINRGEKTKGALIGLIESILWIYIVASVAIGIADNPLKAVLYAVAYSIGNYLGAYVESKIALGLSTIQVITAENTSDLLTVLRANNLAVTVIEAGGMNGPNKILEIHLKRKRITPTVKLINKNIPNCVIAVSDVKILRGGYIRK